MSNYIKDSNATNISAGNAKKPSPESLCMEKIYQNSEDIYQVAKQLAQLKKEYLQSQKDLRVNLF
jgi:hypothetical protein